MIGVVYCIVAIKILMGENSDILGRTNHWRFAVRMLVIAQQTVIAGIWVFAVTLLKT